MRSYSAKLKELNTSEYNYYKNSSKFNNNNLLTPKTPKKSPMKSPIKNSEKFEKGKIEFNYTDYYKGKDSKFKGNSYGKNLQINLSQTPRNKDSFNPSPSKTNKNFNFTSKFSNKISQEIKEIPFGEKSYFEKFKNSTNFVKPKSTKNENSSKKKVRNLSLTDLTNINNNSYKNFNLNSTKNLNNKNNNINNNLNNNLRKSSINSNSNSNSNLHSNISNINSTNFNTKKELNSNSNNINSNQSQSQSINQSINNNNNNNFTINNNINKQKKYNPEEVRFKLKKLFEYYCQFGERLNTQFLKSNKFFKFANEANILEEENPNINNNNNLNKTKIELIFSSENKTKKKSQIDFECFLQCLIKIAEAKYSNELQGANKCLQNLLDKKIFPLYEKLFSITENKFIKNFINSSIANNNNNNSIYGNTFLFENSNFSPKKNIKKSELFFDDLSSKQKNSLDNFNNLNIDFSGNNNNLIQNAPICMSTKNINNKYNILSKIDDIQEEGNSFYNSVACTESNNNNITPEKEKEINSINNNSNNINNNIRENKDIINNNQNNNVDNNNINNSNSLNSNANNNFINSNFGNNCSLSNIIIPNTYSARKSINFDYEFPESQVEEILRNSSKNLYEIYKVYFPWEISNNNNESYIKENSNKNYFQFLKEFELCPNIISKSNAYLIWKQNVEDKLEKISYGENKNNNNKGNITNNNETILMDIKNENFIFSKILKKIEKNFSENSSGNVNNYNNNINTSGNNFMGKYFSFPKFLKCLCLISDIGIDKYFTIEDNNQFENNLTNNNNNNNNSNSLSNSNSNKSKEKEINKPLNNINNKYEYNLSEKLILLLEKMEISKGFENIKHKTSKTNSYRNSFIISKEFSDKIKKEIDNKINEIKKQNNNDLEKREDYENIQRQKKLALSYKNNFKNVFEHRNYITDRYGEKLSDLFKNYCCFGDPLNTTWMKSNKFSKLLKDANLLILSNNLISSQGNQYASNVSNFADNLPSSLISNNNNQNNNNNASNINNILSKHSANMSLSPIKEKTKEKEKGIPVNDIDVIFIKLSTCNTTKDLNINLNSSNFANRDLSMNTYISMGTYANRNSINESRISFCDSFSPNKITNFNFNKNLKRSYTNIPNANVNSAKIDFNGFVNAIEYISLTVFPEINEFEAIDMIVTKYLLPLLKNFNHKNKYSDKYSILYQEMENNFEYNDLIAAFNKAISPIFKYYSDINNNINFENFIKFCTDFEIFPDIISKSKLSNIFKATSANDFSYSEPNENNSIDQFLFVDACCLISLEIQNFGEKVINNIEKFISLIEKISNSTGISKISKDNKYIRISNVGESYSIFDSVRNSAMHLFPQKTKPEKLNFFDILQDE